jgi:hypothetical protein
LIKESLAHPAHQSTESTPDYVLRGQGMFELYCDELEYLGAGKWLIPSGTVAGRLYEVRIRPRSESCECVGYLHHNHCSHLVCAEIAYKKSAVCDACGERKCWTELFEVHEEDELLAWYPGDVLCRACCRHHWTQSPPAF